jgi:hypothetical protein
MTKAKTNIPVMIVVTPKVTNEKIMILFVAAKKSAAESMTATAISN